MGRMGYVYLFGYARAWVGLDQAQSSAGLASDAGDTAERCALVRRAALGAPTLTGYALLRLH